MSADILRKLLNARLHHPAHEALALIRGVDPKSLEPARLGPTRRAVALYSHESNGSPAVKYPLVKVQLRVLLPPAILPRVDNKITTTGNDLAAGSLGKRFHVR